MTEKIMDIFVELPEELNSTESPSMDDLLFEYHEERDMFRFILEKHHDPVFLIKIDENIFSGSFVDFNHYFCNSLGYTRNELFQLDPMSIFAPENISVAERNLNKHMVENSLIWEGIIQTKDREKVPFEIKSFIFKNERYKLLFVFLHDISNYKESNS